MPEEDVWKILGSRAKRERSALGLSLRDAAKAAGVSKNTLLRLESGARVYDETLRRIVKAYGVAYIDPHAATARAYGETGEGFAVRRIRQAPWRLARCGEETPYTLEESQDFANEEERLRLGRNGLALFFQQTLVFDRPGLVSSKLELYREAETAPAPGGSHYFTVVRGSVRLKFVDQDLVLDLYDTVKVERSIVVHFGPVEPVGRADLPPILFVSVPHS